MALESVSDGGYPTSKPSGTPIFSIVTPILAALLSVFLIALVIYFAV